MSARSGHRHRHRHRQEWSRWLAVALACTWGSLFPGTGAISADPAADHTIVIEAVKFTPETLTVKRGATVTWINKDPFPHTVTAPGFFDSRDIPPKRLWRYPTT